MGCVRAPLPRTAGGMTVNVTPGGTDKAAEPILERHCDDVVKALVDGEAWKAGNRNAGMDAVGLIDIADVQGAHRRRTGASIVDSIASAFLEVFSELRMRFGVVYVITLTANQILLCPRVATSSDLQSIPLSPHIVWR